MFHFAPGRILVVFGESADLKTCLDSDSDGICRGGGTQSVH